MGAQKLSEAGVFTVHITAARAILAAFVTALLLHESVRILVQFLAHSLMILQIGLQRRVAFYELLVFRQRRIAAELLGDFLVLVKELIEADYLSVVAVTRILACIIILAVAVVLTVVASVAHIVVVAIANVAICVSVIGITVPYILTIVVALPIIVVGAIVVTSACVVSVVVPPSGFAVSVKKTIELRQLRASILVSTVHVTPVRITLAILTAHIAPVVIAVTVLTGVIILPVINTVPR